MRHAAPLIEPGLCYGSADVAADPQATGTAARALAALLPPGLRVDVSPAARCQQLRVALAGIRADLHFETEPALREFDFGEWELRPWSAIGEAALTAWTDDFSHHRPGGGECVDGFMARVASAFDRRMETGRNAAWITHAGVIRAATLLARGIRRVDRADQWPKAVPAFGRWMTINPA